MTSTSGPSRPTIPLIYAHRGVSVAYPENSLEAFAAAASQGADGVELDVRRSADADLVVHHDPQLADGRVIVELDRSALPSEIPSLAEAMAACHEVRVNIEIKNIPGEPDLDETGIVAAGIVDLVRKLDRTDAVIVSSFNYDDLGHVRRLAPEIATGWLLLGIPDIDAVLGHAVADGHVAIHPPFQVTTAEVIAAAHDRGIQVNTWTVDAPEQIARLAADGVDVIITNDPATARATLTGP